VLRQDVAVRPRWTLARNHFRAPSVVQLNAHDAKHCVSRRKNVKDSSFHSVCSALGSHLGIDPERFRTSQHLSHDWALDALDLNVIALRIEQLEGVELSSVELGCVKTVGQLVNLVRQRKQSHELEAWMHQLDHALHNANRARERRWRARDRRAAH
jgi:acyl carrier protein